MKKSNKTMRLSAVLLVLVLITSCFVGGTFAKYTTSGVGTDTARVAKWGVEITAEGNDKAFAAKYDKGGIASTTANGDIVLSDDGTTKVIAPGTNGTLAAVTIKGKPEVAVKISNVAEVKLNNEWTDKSGKFYCPIQFLVKYGTKTEAVLDGTTCNNAEELQSSLTKLIEKAAKEYAPGTDLATLGDGDKVNVSVDWEWPFYENEERDIQDTALGDKTTAPTISLTVTTTVEQIDHAPTP